jgi:hypothetical protein
LILPEIFDAVWKDFPSIGNHLTGANFWRSAIPQIRQLQPSADLIAEGYWDKERQLHDAGFDYAYNKRVTDFVMRGQNSELVSFLQSLPSSFLRRSVHFLENHDEARAAAVLPLRRHKAAAALILFLPGMALLHEGQLEGRTRFAPIHLNRRPPEEVNGEVSRFYRELLALLQKTSIRRGTPELLESGADRGAIVVRWIGANSGTYFGAVNLGNAQAELDLSQERCQRIIPFFSTDGEVGIESTHRLVIPHESAHVFQALL